MFSRVQLTYPVFLVVCDSSTIRLVQTLGDVLVAALLLGQKIGWDCQASSDCVAPRPFMLSSPFCYCRTNLNFRKMKTLYFCKSTFLLYLSWSLSSLRTMQLKVFPLMSAWCRGKASVTAASLLIDCLSDQTCPHHKKTEPSS